MRSYEQLFAFWDIKIIFSFLLLVISPVKTSIIIIIIMVILDTLTGTACAIALKRFNSKNFKKCIKKIIIYFLCIFTVRLIEIGTNNLMESFLLIQIISAFLIITEGISIIENLTVLGLPLPFNFLNVFYKQVRIDVIEHLIAKRNRSNDELSDIYSILSYQIPSIKNYNLRKELQISTNVWIRISNSIIAYFDNIKTDDNQLIHYKVLSIVNTGIKDIIEDINANVKNNGADKSYHNFESARVEFLLKDIHNICFLIISNESKKSEIIKRITVYLYQLVLDVQKQENKL